MRVSFIYTVLVLGTTQMLQAHEGYGQGLDKLVTVEMKNETLASLFQKLKQETGLSFVFPTNEAARYRVDLPKAERSVREVLDMVLKGRNLTYRFEDNTVYVVIDDDRSKNGGGNNNKASLNSNTEAAQPYVVTGTVTDASMKQPLTGVNVIIKGTMQGTTTDTEGKYSINADDNDVLVFSFIGFKTFEIQVAGRTVIDVALEEDIATLGEVVVNAGYWQVKEKERTGNISRVSSDVIETQPVSNPLRALIGRMPGVQITQYGGVPGTAMTIQIRGRNSIRANANSPLYVIDGVPVSSQPIKNNTAETMLENRGLDPLNTINPENIASVEILKDADATAIYGSRGANGVVLITTKRGTEDRTKVDMSVYTGAGKASNTMDLLNTEQYMIMRNEAFANDGVTPQFWDYDLMQWDQTRYTDWQKELFGGTAHVTDAQASVSGGSNGTFFRFGGGYHKETLVFPGDFGYRRGTGHFSLNHISQDRKFNASISLNYGVDKNKLFNANLVELAVMLPPNAPALYDENGELNWEVGPFGSSWQNPLAPLRQSYEVTGDNLIANTVLSYEIFSGLSFKTNLGYNTLHSKGAQYYPISSYDPAFKSFTTGSVAIGANNTKSWIIEPQFVYTSEISQGQLEALVGTSWQKTTSERQQITAFGYQSDALLGNLTAAPNKIINDSYAEYRYNALFGRIAYNWKRKYLINLTGRRDGSSRFGPDKQFANFWAIGGAWIFSNEGFVKDNQSFLSFGKLRGSYGTTGSDQIEDYGYLDTYSAHTSTYDGAPGYYPTALSNPDYAWEVNKKLELALDLGFIDDRIFLATSWYRNRSSNQLVGYPLPTITGFNSVQYNLDATVENTGWEFDLQSINVKAENFTWTSSFNLTIPRNKLVSYPNIEASSYANTYIVGEPLTITRRYRMTGVDPVTGIYQFQDVDGSGSVTPSDRRVIVNLGQEFFGGLQNKLQYKNFELDFFIQFVKQMAPSYIRNFPPPGFMSNQPSIVFEERWTESGDNAKTQKFTQSYGNYAAYLNASNSDIAVSDASFFRLRTLSLSYRLPGKISESLGIREGRIYLQGQNLFTISDYVGLDPENPGSNQLPAMRMITGGVQVSF